MCILKVTDTKLSSVEPPKRRTSFLESITTSAVEEANTKSRKRQGSDGEGGHLWLLQAILLHDDIVVATKVKRGRSSSGSIGKTADKKVTTPLAFPVSSHDCPTGSTKPKEQLHY